MTVKESVLRALKSGDGGFLSGEELSQALHVTRSGIWKAIEALRAEGYPIEAVTNRGYRLGGGRLTEGAIRRYLSGEAENMRFEILDIIGSTNTRLKELAAKGEPEGLVLMAEEQTAGKGRMGRSFVAPKGDGIYMSLLLRPKIAVERALRLTTIAAVAVAEAIEEASGKKAGVKWVNDVYISRKKVCGILTEAASDLETGLLEYAVIGIGINVRQPEGGYPDAIKDIAGAVFDRENCPADGRIKLTAEVLNRFFSYYRADDQLSARAYRARSIVLGREIVILSTGEKARALDVDDECRLLVELPDHTKRLLSSGEVSVRLFS